MSAANSHGKIGSLAFTFTLEGGQSCIEDTMASFHAWRKDFEKRLKESKLTDRPKDARPCGGCPGSTGQQT